jgi:hypothetical protein
VTAIGICHALLAAESRPGADDEANSLVNMALPHVQNAKQPMPFHGYYYRILSNSGGRFTALAYPAVYRSSGVMTFIVDHNDNVYEKDLGASSAKVASAMTSYQLDSTWAPAEFGP